MTVKASACSALILAAGIFVPCLSPVQAETGTKALVADSSSDSARGAPATVRKHFRHVWRHGYAHRKSQAIAPKADPEKSEPPAAMAQTVTVDSKALREIPPSVANANAQMLLAGVQLSAAAAIPAGSYAQAAPDSATSVKSEAGTQIVAAADQLNEVDRSLQEGGPPAAGAASPPPASAPTMTMTSESSVWDQTSMIGKIFIGFGALLTMASAARLFMA